MESVERWVKMKGRDDGIAAIKVNNEEITKTNRRAREFKNHF